MPNRLAAETSPYLLQHKDNPVDWYPWGEEAFARATAEDKPVLLSVGYSSCHWCHVMEHESFEDPETAATLNEWFVPVKVDREERPDVDSIYMEAVQAMTGHGGWPMTVFLTPDGVPMFAGTYFPKHERPGMPSFGRVMAAVHDAWTNRRDEVLSQAEQLHDLIGRSIPAADHVPSGDDLAAAYRSIAAASDPEHGGFGRAPKFPQEPVLEFLLRSHQAEWAPNAGRILDATLAAMAAGGIYDQLGGGFARYSTDREWLVPHFEKMLYNNAQLARIYLRAWQISGHDTYRRVAIETIDYVLRDLTNEQGGFMAAEDADSEGVEGKFYVWTREELAAALDDDALIELAADWFGVTAHGNFEGSNVLTRNSALAEVADRNGVPVVEAERLIDQARSTLLAARNERIRPGLDDKVITAWNGLMVRALAEAGAILERPDYLAAAERNGHFVLEHLHRPDGRLLRSWSKGRADLVGYLEDYAAYALGLSVLYEATGALEWYEAFADLTRAIPGLFADEVGGLYATGSDAAPLIVRPRDQMDNPTPSGESMAAEAFLRLALYTGESEWLDGFEHITRRAGRLIERAPSVAGHLLAVLTSYHVGMREVAIVGPQARELARPVWRAYRPHLVLAIDPEGRHADEVPLLAGRSRPGDTLAYVCERMTCRAPVSTSAALEAELDAVPT